MGAFVKPFIVCRRVLGCPRGGRVMTLAYDGIVRQGLARQVAGAIRASILDGRLKVDERLPTEEELARGFGVSRPTVREALKVLAAQNLIRSRRGAAGGNFVIRPDPEELSRLVAEAATLLIGTGAFGGDEIAIARLETEALCARLAAGARTAEDLDAMAAEIALQGRADVRDEEFCASDLRFHARVAAATGNGPIRLLVQGLVAGTLPVTNLLILDGADRARIRAAHERIRAAIAARDEEGAAAAMRGHLEGMRGRLTDALARPRPAEGGTT